MKKRLSYVIYTSALQNSLRTSSSLTYPYYMIAPLTNEVFLISIDSAGDLNQSL